MFLVVFGLFFFFKQKTAYEMRISDWSSDVCSSDLGQIDNTIIMYTSDHGERAGAHGMRQKAGTMYREETNIPMIIAHPDVKGGRATKGLMGAIDIAPTLMADRKSVV